jgi:subtilisin family serine protease
MNGLDELRQENASLDRADEKLDSRLRGLRGLRPGDRLRLDQRPNPGWKRGDHVRVSVRLDALDDDAREALAAAGLTIERESPRRALVEGWTVAGNLAALAGLDGVRSVRPADRGMTRVTSAGDIASRANLARGLGVTGLGVRVGVISDGIDGAAASRARGELPVDAAQLVPLGCAAGGGSEGTAILEIVHDLAPDATLLFSSGVDSPMAFVDALHCLTAAGANVIVDDLGFFGEPYFADGDLADAVRAVVQGGVSYHTAAGNSALLHYEGEFRPSPQSKFHNFSTGSGVDNTNGVSIPPGGSLLCVLQWDDPFGRADDNYDLLLVDQNRNPIAVSDSVQNGSQDPLEIVTRSNNSATTEVDGLVIERARGDTRTLELFCVRDVQGMEYVTPTSSIFGHAAVAEAVTVAAIDAADPGLDTVERFSGQGPVRLAFPPETRAKPDVAGFDGVNTSVPGFAPFFGTSAAAPHVAAIAALMLQRNPFITPATIRSVLTATAVDIGAPGFDDVAGAGRVDALAAVNAVPPPECPPDSACDDGDLCTTDRCEQGRCMHVPVSCDDGNPCNGLEICQPDSGACVPGAPAADGTPCPDGTVCNGDELCSGGACTPGTPRVCDDGDTCTENLCAPDAGCQFPALDGVASVRCVLDRGLPSCPGVELPASVQRRFARAQHLIDRGESARRRRKQRLLVRRAARVLKQAATAVTRAPTLPPECVTSLSGTLGAARERARAVAQALR